MYQKRLQVPLSDDQWLKLEEVVAARGYRTYSEFVRQLILKEVEKYENQRIR